MSTDTKHTPAPWWRDDDGFIAAGSGETYVTVADADCSDMDIDEREANKTLIIAAPEMIESLAECAMLLMGIHLGQVQADDMGIRCAADRSLDLIRKAKGRQP